MVPVAVCSQTPCKLLSEVAESTDRSGRRQVFAYDDLGRLTQETWFTGTTLERTLAYTLGRSRFPIRPERAARAVEGVARSRPRPAGATPAETAPTDRRAIRPPAAAAETPWTGRCSGDWGPLRNRPGKSTYVAIIPDSRINLGAFILLALTTNEDWPARRIATQVNHCQTVA